MSAVSRLHSLGARNRALWVVLAGSLVLHLAVLLLIGMRAGLDMSGHRAAPQPLYIHIEPRPLMPGEIVREPPLTVIDTPRETPALAREMRARALRLIEEDEEESRRVEALRLPVRSAPADQGVEPRWRVGPDTTGDRVARALRASGLACGRPRAEMTAAERAACDDRFAGSADVPAIRGTGGAERDAAFERQGRANMAQWEAQRAPLAGGTGVVGPADCVGSNLGMGCAGAHMPSVPGVDMRQGAETPIRQRSNRPPD